MRLTVSIIALTIGLASCTGSSKVATTSSNTTKAERKKMACADVHVEMSSTHLDWVLENSTVLNKSDEFLVLPKEYKVYSIDSMQAYTFFNAIQNGTTASTVVPLPAPADCQIFTMKNGAKKGIPAPKGLIACAGESMGQKLAMNFNDGKIAARIDWFEIVYEIQTATVSGKPYYIIYPKQAPVQNKNVNPAANMPVIEEIKYDK